MDINKLPQLKFSVSPSQAKHLESIRWLYYGPFQTGRSHLQAIALIELAWRDKNIWITARDHSGSVTGDNFLLNIIHHLINQQDEEIKNKAEFNMSSNSFRFKGLSYNH